MQLSFFPELLPDEPIYSVTSRYHEALLYSSYKDSVEELFGYKVSASVDLPSRLGELAKRLPWESLTECPNWASSASSFPLPEPRPPRLPISRRNGCSEFSKGKAMKSLSWFAIRRSICGPGSVKLTV